MMNIKTILTIALAVGGTFAIGYGLIEQSQETQQSAEVDQAPAVSAPVSKMAVAPMPEQAQLASVPEIAKPIKRPASNKPQEIPNYDTRQWQTVKAKPQPTMSREQSTKVMAEKQAEMEKLVAMYDASLSDPKRRADIERKFKLHMEDYKQALIAKSQRGEL